MLSIVGQYVEGFKKLLAEQLQAIREGLLWILPCLMIISLILFVASIGEFIFGKDEAWVKTLFELHYFVNDLFPILLTAAMAIASSSYSVGFNRLSVVVQSAV